MGLNVHLALRFLLGIVIICSGVAGSSTKDDAWRSITSELSEVEIAVARIYGVGNINGSDSVLRLTVGDKNEQDPDHSRIESYFRKKVPFLVHGSQGLSSFGWPSRFTKAALRKSKLKFQLTAGAVYPFASNDSMPSRGMSDVFDCIKDERYLVFDSRSPHRKSLAKKLPTPKWLSRRFVESTSARPILSLGGPRSGIPWHTHGDTWIASLVGRKRWFVYPPGNATGTLRGHPFYTAVTWTTRTLPLLSADHRPLTFLQMPGEIVYLPAGWAHLTLNVDEVLAFGQQLNLEDEDIQLVERGCTGEYESPSHVDPESCILRGSYMLEVERQLENDNSASSSWFRLAHKVSPFHILAWKPLLRTVSASDDYNLKMNTIASIANSLQAGVMDDPDLDNLTLAYAWSVLWERSRDWKAPDGMIDAFASRVGRLVKYDVQPEVSAMILGLDISSDRL